MVLLSDLGHRGWINHFTVLLVKKTIEFVILSFKLSLFCVFDFLFLSLSNLLEVGGVIFDILNINFDLLLLVSSLFLLMMLVLALGLFGGFKLDIAINWGAINSSNGAVVIMIITIKLVKSQFTIFDLVFFVHIFIKRVDTLRFFGSHLLRLKSNIKLFFTGLKHLVEVLLSGVTSRVRSLDSLGLSIHLEVLIVNFNTFSCLLSSISILILYLNGRDFLSGVDIIIKVIGTDLLFFSQFHGIRITKEG